MWTSVWQYLWKHGALDFYSFFFKKHMLHIYDPLFTFKTVSALLFLWDLLTVGKKIHWTSQALSFKLQASQHSYLYMALIWNNPLKTDWPSLSCCLTQSCILSFSIVRSSQESALTLCCLSPPSWPYSIFPQPSDNGHYNWLHQAALSSPPPSSNAWKAPLYPGAVGKYHLCQLLENKCQVIKCNQHVVGSEMNGSGGCVWSGWH